MPEPSWPGLTPVAAQLAAAGRVAVVETRGRVTGNPAVAAVGFVREPDGSLLVAAGDPDADWARNLQAEPECRVTLGGVVGLFRAEPLSRAEAIGAVRDLILRYGTPSEGLGQGPAFRLRPLPAAG